MPTMRSPFRSPLPILLAIVVDPMISRGTFASHLLGTTHVTVQSNETLRMISEFNHTTSQMQLQFAARAANTTIQNIIASRLALEFNICFPDKYCPVVTNNADMFHSRFLTHVCNDHCSHIHPQDDLEVLSVCESQHQSYHESGCIDFGLTIQASSVPEAEEIRKELGASIATSKQVWRELLHQLAPHFGDYDIDDPGINGYDISQDLGETWYPAWDKGHERCSNDGAVPFYMKLDPEEYLAPTMTDCCRKHYWWNVRECAEPEKRPCPEGYVPTPEQIAREGIMTGKYYGSYPNIWYSGCIPETSPQSHNRELHHTEEDVEKEAQRRELRHREQEHKLVALLERQRRLEKLMPPTQHTPPVHVDWKPQRLR